MYVDHPRLSGCRGFAGFLDLGLVLRTVRCGDRGGALADCDRAELAVGLCGQERAPGACGRSSRRRRGRTGGAAALSGRRCTHAGCDTGFAATATAAARSLRAASACSRLSREEIRTAARIAPAMAKPAPTRNARSNPCVRAIEALCTPAWSALWVRLLAIVARIASPSAPPICRVVLFSPEARPASRGSVLVTAAIVTGTNENPSPAPASSDGPSTSAR